MFSKYPPLRIHAWGGLGSQLFAIALASSLKERFPERRQIVVLHSGGITKRIPEIYSLFPEFEYLEIDDFHPEEGLESAPNSRSTSRRVRNVAVNILRKTRFLATENDGITSGVKFWTLSVRGHYFYRPIDFPFLKILRDRLSQVSDSSNPIIEADCVLHYRLGDLEYLLDKTFVSPKRISKVVRDLTTLKSVVVFSDSPELALIKLREESKSKSFKSIKLSAVDSIHHASMATIFIGTSSKISFWIVLLRFAENATLLSYLPLENKVVIETLLPGISSIKYY